MLISINADATGKEISASIRALNESYRPVKWVRLLWRTEVVNL